jgi:hypothetical protein
VREYGVLDYKGSTRLLLRFSPPLDY